MNPDADSGTNSLGWSYFRSRIRRAGNVDDYDHGRADQSSSNHYRPTQNQDVVVNSNATFSVYCHGSGTLNLPMVFQ
jgi:hypothetical protein